uniref:Uncharacterized protein n=1 Tax=Erpetoichthys calabaricus TaxID=27687 RepID=A0A8C4T6C5_ERPCA
MGKTGRTSPYHIWQRTPINFPITHQLGTAKVIYEIITQRKVFDCQHSELCLSLYYCSLFEIKQSISMHEFKLKRTQNITTQISGNFNSEELIAIMGPSSAGKPTIEYSGWLRRTGVKCDINEVYVPLGNCHAEAMMISVNLKLKDKHQIHKAIGLEIHVLQALGLLEFSKTCTGKLHPSIHFPTHSFLSLPLFSLMKALAQGGRTVICTIHQPSANLSNKLFDKLYVLIQLTENHHTIISSLSASSVNLVCLFRRTFPLTSTDSALTHLCLISHIGIGVCFIRELSMMQLRCSTTVTSHFSFVSLVAQSLDLFFGSSRSSVQVSIYVGPVCIVPILLFSGYLVKFTTIHRYFQWSLILHLSCLKE